MRLPLYIGAAAAGLLITVQEAPFTPFTEELPVPEDGQRAEEGEAGWRESPLGHLVCASRFLWAGKNSEMAYEVDRFYLHLQWASEITGDSVGEILDMSLQGRFEDLTALLVAMADQIETAVKGQGILYGNLSQQQRNAFNREFLATCEDGHEVI